MPVLPLVASTIVVRPGSIRPSRSAASIIATPMRSLTEPPGLNISSLPNTRPPPSGASRANSTIGVRPTWSAMLIGISAIPGALVWHRLVVGVDAPRLVHARARVEPERARVVGGDAERHRTDARVGGGAERGEQEPGS